MSSEGREEVKETKLKNGEAGRRRARGEAWGSREVVEKGQEREEKEEEPVTFIIYHELGEGTTKLRHRQPEESKLRNIPSLLNS